MKTLSVHVAILFALVVAACSLGRGPASVVTPTKQSVPTAAATKDEWRRTVNGWERTSNWSTTSQDRTIWNDIMSVHPIIWAALQVLLSVGALVLFDNGTPARAGSSKEGNLVRRSMKTASPNRPLASATCCTQA